MVSHIFSSSQIGNLFLLSVVTRMSISFVALVFDVFLLLLTIFLTTIILHNNSRPVKQICEQSHRTKGDSFIENGSFSINALQMHICEIYINPFMKSNQSLCKRNIYIYIYNTFMYIIYFQYQNSFLL